MNSQLYVTADILHRNSQPSIVSQQPLPQPQPQPQSQQILVSDVFEIPEIISNVPMPSNINIPSALASTANMNFIKSINHTAMTDVMNQLANKKQKTPSIGTKQSELSLQVPHVPLPQQQIRTVLSPTTHNPAHAIQSPVSVAAAHASTGVKSLASIPLSETGINDSSFVGGTAKKNISKHISKNTLNKKVIIEEEDKDSEIDYDDDDIDIKKTKLSLFQFAKDITFNLIFAIPFLQKARLHAMLRDSTLAINQIERIFDEFKDRFSQFDLETIKRYVCEDGIRDQLNFILVTGFNKILSDGIIDVNDAPQFNQLVYYIIKSFNDINQGKVYRFYVSREHVMLLLHFVLKSVFSLTLKGQEEQMALGLLDTSFKLVQLEVLPIVSKRWYHRFRICKSAKQIEDIIE